MKRKIVKKILCLAPAIIIAGTLSHYHIANGAVYTAAKGDSLYKISKLFSMKVPDLMKSNKLQNAVIYPGQKLAVTSTTYRIKKGDTLFLLARRKSSSLALMRAVNSGISDKLAIGQVINIPAKTATLVPLVVPAQPDPILSGTDPGTTSGNTPAPTPTPTPVPVQNPTEVQPGTDSTITASEIDLLARLITAEAAGEDFNAKVAVGAVVLNRMKSDTFPDTVSDVIYQVAGGHYQFTPVLNGWINKPADEASITAAYAAVNGQDPTNGALFYFDHTVTNKWLLGKPVSVRIGNLIFSF